MQTFDKRTFILDALRTERKRIINEIDAIIAEVENGGSLDSATASAGPLPSGEPVEASRSEGPPMAPVPPEQSELEDGKPEASGESPQGSEEVQNPLTERTRQAFENRKSIAYDAVKHGGGEVSFSAVVDFFEAKGVPKEERRLVRSALSSLVDDELLYNIKRSNPSNNTWALWDHPNAVVARSNGGDGQQTPSPPQYDLNSL